MIRVNPVNPLTVLINPLCMCNRVTVLGLCVCVCLSVTTLAATAFVCLPKLRYHRVIHQDFLDLNTRISLKRIRSRDMALLAYPG